MKEQKSVNDHSLNNETTTESVFHKEIILQVIDSIFSYFMISMSSKESKDSFCSNLLYFTEDSLKKMFNDVFTSLKYLINKYYY